MLAPKWAFAAAIPATAAIAAGAVGADPFIWALSAFGAAVVYVKSPATTRPDAIINACLSILLGSIGGPIAADWMSAHVGPELGNDYLWVLALSSTWPWVVQLVWPLIKSFAAKRVENTNA